MKVDIPPDLHLQVHQIRNIQLWKSDLLPLIAGKQKIPNVPINAFGAYLQQENQNDCEYTIFSSWIGAFVSGAANEGQAEGTKLHSECV